jgi:CRP-like cAMP-binding protein
MSRSVLSEEEQHAILDLPGYAAQVRANRDFVRLGEVVDHACLVIDGLVGQFGQNAEGVRQITALQIPGDMANVHSVVLPKATSALQALCTSTILRVPQTAIRAAMRRYPALAEAVWRDCMVDAAILSQWVVNIGRRDARTRMAHLLCEMATRYKGTIDTKEVAFEFSVNQAHLGDATGLTSVHVNRTLKALRDSGHVIMRNRHVTILNWQELTAIGDFDPTYLQTDVKPEERLRILHVA